MQFVTARYSHILSALSLLFNFSTPLIAQDFTIEQVMSAPYLTDLSAAPNTDQIAWVENLQGVRNVWMASTPDFHPIKLTNYSEDDGQPISNLCFTHDSSFLVYVRGGSINRAGEHPNPTSDPLGTEQEVWAVETHGNSLPWKLAHGNDPVPSPKNNEVLYTDGGQIFIVPIFIPGTNNGNDLNPKQFVRARGRNNSPNWSPDGRKIAFVSARGDHNFIGVSDYETHKIVWVAPGVDRDGFPVWSPDGKKLAFIRSPGAKKNEMRNLTGGNAFAIWVADLEKNKAEEIWRSPSDDGGFAQYYPAEPLRWTRQNQLLFYSEHENWMHIYSISPKGGDTIDLTPGKSEAEHSFISPDGKFLYFSSNEGDIDRRHLWHVALPVGVREPFTNGMGIETEPVVLASGNFVAYRLAGATLPSAIVVTPSVGGSPQRVAPQELPKSFPQRDLVVPEQVIIKAADGLEIHGQLFLPKNAKAGDDKPAVIFMHGGPIRQMLLGWHYRGYYAKTYAMNQYLANKGYIVLSVNYRSGIGYGKAFRRAEKQGPRGASEYQDIVAAGKYLQNRPEVDPNRIGLWGGSYGGYLTAMGLARNSDLFAAGIDLHGVHDWAFRATDFSPGAGWGLQGEEALELAFQSSPVADLSKWHSPVLFVHGDDDRNVLFQQTTDLVQRLRERGVHIELLVFPDEVHGFLRHENWLRIFRAAADFFDRFLMKKK